MQLIVRMEFGSFLYGTNTPLSDRDYKGVFIPDVDQIIFGDAKDTEWKNKKADQSKKNTAEDVDEEWYSLKKYMQLLSQSQTVACDMLFCTKELLLYKTPLWDEIIANREKFLSNQTTSFLGYCRTQANKYGIKGSRVATVRRIVDYLHTLPLNTPLQDHLESLSNNCWPLEHASIDMQPCSTVDSHKQIPYLTVCDRSCPGTASVKYALSIYEKVLESYGVRALQAEKNENIDWKALSHAVRIYHEAVELLTTAWITFPRPERKLLLEIKQGEKDYAEVASIIEQGLLHLEELAPKSVLRPTSDKEFIRNFTIRTYKNAILSH